MLSYSVVDDLGQIYTSSVEVTEDSPAPVPVAVSDSVDRGRVNAGDLEANPLAYIDMSSDLWGTDLVNVELISVAGQLVSSGH